MTRRPSWFYILGYVAIVVSILALPADFWLKAKRTRLSDQQAREMLNREVPIGTDKSMVKKFLEAKYWSYSDRGSTIQAMVRDASHSLLVQTDIQIEFFFDSSGKLVSYEIRDFLTGP